MKKTNYIKQLTLYQFILIVFLFSLLSPFPTEALTVFSFDISSPTNISFLKDKNVSFSGPYSIDPAATLSVKVVIDNIDPSNPEDISSQIIQNPATWSYNRDFSDGVHSVTFIASDGTTTITKDVSFTVDTKRPVVKEYKIISDQHVGNSKTWADSIIEDMAHVPLDAKFQIKIEETNNLKFNKDANGVYNPIIIMSENQSKVTSVEDWSILPQRDSTTGNYILTFTPNKQLDPSTTYYMNITTDIVDDSGNSVYPKVIKFTTTSQKDDSVNDDDPHGDYDISNPNISDPSSSMNRTNLCANCHNTHMGGSVKLLGGKYVKDTSKNPTDPDNTTNYCMACHDGTTATRMASKVDNMDLSTGSKHDEVLDTKHLPNEGSCASCHNPHLVWSQDNPNILKDHFVFDHTKVDPAKNAPQQVIDSDEILCESCHGLVTYTRKGDQGVEYKISHYRKSTNRLGNTAPNNNILEDDDLCFRCHNPNKLQKGDVQSDIQTLYEDTNSKHNFAALDGSNVIGPLPCAECHETHGSNNIKLLKSKLGQENRYSDFSATSGDWSADKERDFCLKCHNGTTAVYGVTGNSLDPSKSSGHDPNSQDSAKACSECHGGTSKSFIEAAHAPKAGITP